MTSPVDRWLDDVVERHASRLARPEFLKAVRALSARYVERRNELGRRSPTDSAGKRAAFAGFFAPLHFVTMREIVRALRPASRVTRRILDFGCGTATASAAWALDAGQTPDIVGIDREAWALDEAVWNWRALGVRGRTRRGDLSVAAEPPARRDEPGTAALFAWSVNELTAGDRTRLLPSVIARARRGDTILVVEPLARTSVPWWPQWEDTLGPLGARSDVWKFETPLPPRLAELDEAAGFRREALGARTLFVCATKDEDTVA